MLAACTPTLFGVGSPRYATLLNNETTTASDEWRLTCGAKYHRGTQPIPEIPHGFQHPSLPSLCSACPPSKGP